MWRAELIKLIRSTFCDFQKWQDVFLRWDPVHFGGIKYFVLPASAVWLPDIVIKNRSQRTCFRDTLLL